MTGPATIASSEFRVFVTEVSQNEPFTDNSGTYTLTIPSNNLWSSSWEAPEDGVVYAASGAFSIYGSTDNQPSRAGAEYYKIDDGDAPLLYYFDKNCDSNNPDPSNEGKWCQTVSVP